MILPDLSPLETDAAAGPVMSEIRRERWRKARDAAKELCRKDRTRYLPLLVAANAGLAQDLLNRGLTQDAAAVLDYLKTIAPPELLTALHQRQAEGQATAALRKATGGNPEGAVIWQVAEAAAQGLEEGREPVPEAIRAADRLVTAGWTLPDAATPFAVELRAVRAAVQATGDGLWDAAKEALQALPRRSLFQHWRFFLRGVRHAHLGEKAEAQRCFDALPAGSAPARAAALYRDLLDLPATADTAPARASTALLAALAAVPAVWLDPLTEAQRHWHRGKLDKAYEALANPLRQHFPTDLPGLGSLLTDILLASCAGQSGLPHAAQQDLATLLYSRYDEKRFRSDREALFAIRFILHEDGPALDPRDLEEFGAELIRVWARTARPDPLRESAVWTLLAGYVQSASPTGTGLTTPEPSEVSILRRFYEKAAALDPDHPSPAVRLAQFHLSAADHSTYNTLLDDLVKRFPEDKSVLLLGADESIRRQSWSKALKTLRQARAADPSDHLVAGMIVKVLLKQALGLIGKGQPVPDNHWQEMEPLLLDLPPGPDRVPDSFAFGRSRWAVRTLQGFVGVPGAHAEAGRLAPSPWTHRFLTEIIMQHFGIAYVPADPDAPPSWQDLLWIAHLIEWDNATGERNPRGHANLSDLLTACIRRLKPNQGLTVDPAGMLAAVHRYQMGLCKAPPFQPSLWGDACMAFAPILAAQARKKKSAYPFRLAALIVPGPGRLQAGVALDLAALLDEATAAGDAQAMELASHYLRLARDMQDRPPVPLPWEADFIPDKTDGGAMPFDPPDDDDGDYQDDDDPAILETIQLIAAMIKLFPKSRINEVRRGMIADGMTPETWKSSLALAKIAASAMTRKEAIRIVESGGPDPEAPTLFQPDLF